MFREKNLLSIVVPVFNEEESIAQTLIRLFKLRADLSQEVEIELLLVDDGSRDSTLQILKQKAMQPGNSCLKVISLSRNFGHQIAITAGIDLAEGDFVAVIDADLQDPPELIVDMYRMALTGFDVVYGKRRSRAGESVFKKFTAAVFYRLLNYMCELEIPTDTGDFRLMSRNVVDAFKLMRERHRFVRGMVPWLGFRSVAIEYDRAQRFAGVTKYPLKKMIAFATIAILSFSSKPLTLAIRMGLITICIGIIGGLYVLYQKIFTSMPIPGLTAILLSIVIFGGIQILLIGVVGTYIARIFEEVKGRPLYLVAELIRSK
jgi:glycosyltransferase involved in cell wall biosynthesis